MSLNFNPEEFKSHNQKMQPVIISRFNTDLQTVFSSSVKYGIVKNKVQFFDYQFVNLQDFLFFVPDFVKESPELNLIYLGFDSYGTGFFNKKLITNFWYGYYQIDFSQAEESKQHVWLSNDFVTLLGNLGGYATALTTVCSVLLSNYQAFIFDKSMLKKLYFQQLKEY